MDLDSNILVVCPNPTFADRFRMATNSKFDVITIAKWISSIELTKEQQRVSKSELMLRVASAWRNYFPQSGIDLFLNSFELFTEIRSFTLDLEIALNLISDLDDELQKSFKIFWAVLQSEKLIDEHLSYEIKKSYLEDRSMLFVGFKHLSGVQIDLLKEASLDRDVYIYFPAAVKSESLNTDWINWLFADKLNDQKSGIEKTKLNVVEFPSRKLNLYLNETMKTNELKSLVSLESKGHFNSRQELFIKKIKFKQSIDLFKTEKSKLFKQIEDLKNTTVSELINWLVELKKKQVEVGNYLSVKVADLIIDSLELYKTYNDALDIFVLKIISNVVELNTPRNYFITMSNETDLEICTLEEAKFLNENHALAVILSLDTSPFKAKESKYSKELIAKLKDVGPLKRGGFDLSFYRAELIDILKNSNAILFIEIGMVESDLGVKELEKIFEFNYLDIKINSEKKAKDPLHSLITQKKESSSLSASRLQTYFDCPRKYYFSYLYKMDLRPDDKMGIGSDERGILEHEIIENYFKKHNELNLETIKKETKSILDNHILINKNVVDNKEYNEVFYELVEYSNNGLSFLFNLKKDSPFLNIYFEESLASNKFNIRGAIDCLVEYEDHFEIYDFKRSSFGTGTSQGFKNFEKLQLWIYGIISNDKKRVSKIAYVDISDNKVIATDPQSKFDEFEIKLSSLIEELKIDAQFRANPRKESVCTYCSVAKLCSRGNL